MDPILNITDFKGATMKTKKLKIKEKKKKMGPYTHQESYTSWILMIKSEEARKYLPAVINVC